MIRARILSTRHPRCGVSLYSLSGSWAEPGSPHISTMLPSAPGSWGPRWEMLLSCPSQEVLPMGARGDGGEGTGSLCSWLQPLDWSLYLLELGSGREQSWCRGRRLVPFHGIFIDFLE